MIEKKMQEISSAMAGVAGTVAGALERRRLPPSYALLNMAGKLRIAADKLEELAGHDD